MVKRLLSASAFFHNYRALCSYQLSAAVSAWRRTGRRLRLKGVTLDAYARRLSTS